jgi:starch phosphorylase
MRIMLDECGYGWDAAWDIVCPHHRLHEPHRHERGARVLERRPVQIPPAAHLPDRGGDQPPLLEEMRAKGVDEGKIWRMAPLCDGYVRMANLAVLASHSTNGVSALHSEILKDSVFHDFYTECRRSLRTSQTASHTAAG